MTKITILPNVKVYVKTELNSQSQSYKGNCETRGRMTHIVTFLEKQIIYIQIKKLTKSKTKIYKY